MDYSGNYYRANHADQLVAVAGEQEATAFTFAQANSRICVGKKAAFYCMVPIEDKADDTEIEEVENSDMFIPEEQEKMDKYEHISPVKELTYDEEAIDLVELLRVCRENRRDIKDELKIIEYFQNNLGTNANAAKAKQALKSIKGLETRKYKPRKYDELFENCILKDKRLQREDICVTECSYENRKEKFSVEYTAKDEGGEGTMIEEKNYTPFDGKENDWLSFAKQQAEFYRNARQYITNLRIDIREIDE